MFTCVICRFDCQFDDAVAPAANGRCVCLRCFARETESTIVMPRQLQQDVSSALAALPASWA